MSRQSKRRVEVRLQNDDRQRDRNSGSGGRSIPAAIDERSGAFGPLPLLSVVMNETPGVWGGE